MAPPEVHLVRCAGCGRNFETARFGELSCPTCRARIWLEPPEGYQAEPEPAAVPGDRSGAGEVGEAPQGQSEAEPTDGYGAESEPQPETTEAAPEQEPDLERGDAPLEPDRLFEAADGMVYKAVPPPWETLGSKPLGRFGATLKLALLAPGALFATLPRTGYRRAFFFGWIVGTIGVLFFSLYGLWQLDSNRQAHLDLLKANADLGALGLSPEQVLELMREFLTFTLLACPLIAAANLWISAGLNHLGVLMVAGRGRRFEATFRATAYAFAPLVVLVVPAIGNLVGFFWVVVLQVIAIAYVHRISMGRATLAVLLPLFSVVMLLLLPGS